VARWQRLSEHQMLDRRAKGEWTLRLDVARNHAGVYVLECDLILDRPTPYPHETIEHEPCEVLTEMRANLMFVTHSSRRTQGDDGARTWGRIRAVLDMEPEPQRWLNGWTHARLLDLADLMAEWDSGAVSLNAGCAHQTVVYDEKPYRRPSLERTQPCPHTGYRYGSAWLCKPPPAEVVKRFEELVGVPIHQEA